MTKAIIFDCFGVLASEAWIQFRNQYFGHDQLLMREANDAMKALGLGVLQPEEFLQLMGSLSGQKPDTLYTLFYRNIPDEQLFSWIRDRKGKYVFSILSNIQHGRLEHIFSAEQLALFDDFALSCDIGLTKPDLRAYSCAAERLGLEARQCLFVDDQQQNVVAAHEAGMKGIWYKTFTQFEKEVKELLD